MKLRLHVLQGDFTIHRFPPQTGIPNQLAAQEFFSICRTSEELSIVCPSTVPLTSERSENGWSCIKVLGPLDFNLTGILADISNILSREEISIFAISTFDTDYILVKSEKLLAAKKALQKAGHVFQQPQL